MNEYISKPPTKIDSDKSRCARCGMITEIRYEFNVLGKKYDLCSTCHEQFELKTYLGTEDFSWMKKHGSS